MTEKKYKYNDDADFYKNISYRNKKEYLEKLIEMNITPDEINNKDILDYGCGAGDASFRFADLSPSHVTGIDIGERNIDLANKRIKEEKLQNVEFIMADLNLYDLGQKKFDLIWSDTTIELLRKPVELILGDFRRALRSKGVCYISFTRKNIFNITLYSILKIIRKCVPEKFRFIFYYLILPRYYIAKLFSKTFKIDHKELKEKINYLFIPYIRFISRDSILELMEGAGFKVQYIRERIKSDISSPPHLEIKAILK